MYMHVYMYTHTCISQLYTHRKNERREQNINSGYFWLIEIYGYLFIILFFTYCSFFQIVLNKCVTFIVRELLKSFSFR